MWLVIINREKFRIEKRYILINGDGSRYSLIHGIRMNNIKKGK
jgi:hypothetical protein